MKTNRWLMSGLLLVALFTLLFLPMTAQAKTLKVWAGSTTPEIHDMWLKLKAAFEKENPNVTVEYMIPAGNIDNGAVQAAIRSGAGPDVILTNAGIGRVGLVAGAGLIKPLTDYYQTRDWESRIHDWLYDELKMQYGGEIYEFPDGLDAIGLWYHKDLMAEYGFELPTSTAEFRALGDKIKAKGLYPLVVGPRSAFNGGHLFGTVIHAVVGREGMTDIVYGDGAWNSPKMVEAAALLQSLVEDGYVPKEAVGLDQSQALNLWFNQRAMFVVAGPWIVDHARAAGVSMDDYGYIAMPSMDPSIQAMPTGGIGWSWMVSSTTKEHDLAVTWVDFISREDIMVMRAEHPASWQLYPKELPPFEPSVEALKDVFASASDGVGFNPSVYIPGNVLEAYYQVIQGLIGSIVKPQDGMDMIQKEWERAR